MKHLEKKCLCCLYFRTKNLNHGTCRLDKTTAPDYPLVALEDFCKHWKTSGQQYYIRAGWLKRQRKEQMS